MPPVLYAWGAWLIFFFARDKNVEYNETLT